MNFFETVYEIVKNIPKGMVMNYGTVAFLAGNPRSSRQVGWALHSNPNPLEIPCHRVVAINGSLSCSFAFGGIDEHKRRLIAEGVKFVDNNVAKECFVRILV